MVSTMSLQDQLNMETKKKKKVLSKTSKKEYQSKKLSKLGQVDNWRTTLMRRIEPEKSD